MTAPDDESFIPAAEQSPDEMAFFFPPGNPGLRSVDRPRLEAELGKSDLQGRARAARLLVLIPQAPIIERLQRYGESLLIMRDGALDIAWPRAVAPEWSSDGAIDPSKPDDAGAAANAILSLVDPQHWSAHFKLQPNALIDAAAGSPFKDAILFHWVTAARHHLCWPWLAALLALTPTAEAAGLVAFRALVTPFIGRDPLVPTTRWLVETNRLSFPQLLCSVPEAWREPFAAVVMHGLRRGLSRPDLGSVAADPCTPFLLIAAHRLPANALPAALDLARSAQPRGPHAEPVAAQIKSFRETLEERIKKG